MSDDVEILFERFRAAEARAMEWRSLYEEAYRFSIPARDTVNNKTAGQKRNAQIFDTTIVHAIRVFVGKLISGLTPEGQTWAKLVAGSDVPAQFKSEINEQLEVITQILFKYLNASNFARAISEAYYDLAIGMGSLICKEGSLEEPLIFESIPLLSIYTEPGPDGTLDSIWRDFEGVKISHIKRMWKRAKLLPTHTDALRENSLATTSLIEGTIWDNGKYRLVVLDKSTRKPLFDSISDSSPWIVFRWSKMPNETNGRGVVLDALPTIQSLQKAYETELRANEWNSNLLFLGTIGRGFNPWTTQIEPAMMLPVTENDPPPLSRVDTQTNVQYSQLTVGDLRQQINNLMFGNPLGPVKPDSMSATEVTMRMQMIHEEINPFVGRQKTEGLQKILKRTYWVLRKKGLVPALEINGRQVDIEYVSPLAASQGLQNALRFQQFYGAMQETVGPQLSLGAIKPQLLPEYLGEQYGVDMNLIQSPEEIAKMAQLAQAAQQQTELPQNTANATTPIPGLNG